MEKSTLLTSISTTLDSSGVAGAATTEGSASSDVLMVFYESASQGSTTDAIIVRYQEGTTTADAFSSDLSIVAVLQGVTDITDTNLA